MPAPRLEAATWLFLSPQGLLSACRQIWGRRLADACTLWAFNSLTRSPGARRYYDTIRARGKTHQQALRQLANRWVGILHGCLTHHTTYREDLAWPRAGILPWHTTGGSLWPSVSKLKMQAGSF